MMFWNLVAAALLVSTPASTNSVPQAIDYESIAKAISAGRLDQARAMVAAAVERGASGDSLERMLAELEDAQGRCDRAVPRYAALLGKYPADAVLAERAAIASLKCGNLAQAKPFLRAALAAPKPSWQTWNAQGVLCDLEGKWTDAQLAYERADALAPGNALIANNRGWSLLLQGRWEESIAALERAVQIAPHLPRAAANLELARTATDASLPRRRAGESAEAWGTRLNDAGVLAGLRGDRKKAIAAFSQALEARSQWFERAANNLKLAETQK